MILQLYWEVSWNEELSCKILVEIYFLASFWEKKKKKNLNKQNFTNKYLLFSPCSYLQSETKQKGNTA